MIIYQIPGCRTEKVTMKKPASSNKALSQSPISEAIGAKIDIMESRTGMYLVLGDTVSPESLIVKNGGEIALKISTFIFPYEMSNLRKLCISVWSRGVFFCGTR